MKVIVFLISVLFITSCMDKAEDIPLSSLDQHIAYQEDKKGVDSTDIIDLIEEYELLAKDNKDSTEVHYLLGRIDRKNAENHFKRSLELNQNFYPALLAMAEIKSESDPSSSLFYATKAIELEEEQGMAYYYASLALLNSSVNQKELKSKKLNLRKASEFLDLANNKNLLDSLLIQKVRSRIQKASEEINIFEKKAVAEKYSNLLVDCWVGVLNPYILIIRKNGTFVIGENRKKDYNGTWSVDSEGITFLMDGSVFMKGKLQSDELIALKVYNGDDLIMQRVPRDSGVTCHTD